MNSIQQLSLFDSPKDTRPLPLITADKWNYPLAHILPNETNPDYLYCARDWYIGLGGKKSAWSQHKNNWFTVDKPVMIEVKRERRKPEMMEFITANGLYSIAARMTSANDRPQLDEIKDYLAKAGVKLDEYRINPEQAVNDAMGQYIVDGKSDSWAEARVQGIVTRKRFTDALKAAVMNAPSNLYAVGTESVYKGLWERTTAQLRGDLNLTPKQNVRDSMSEYALVYTRLAEMLATDQIQNAETVSMTVASDIIYRASGIIRQQALQTARFLGIDLFTGRATVPEFGE